MSRKNSINVSSKENVSISKLTPNNIELRSNGTLYISTDSGNGYAITADDRYGIRIDPVGASLVPRCDATLERPDLFPYFKDQKPTKRAKVSISKSPKAKELKLAVSNFKKMLKSHTDVIANERDAIRELISDHEEILSCVDEALDEFECVDRNLQDGVDKLSELM